MAVDSVVATHVKPFPLILIDRHLKCFNHHENKINNEIPKSVRNTCKIKKNKT